MDSTEESWKYCDALSCATLLEDKKLLVLMFIPLLDRKNIFEIYQVVNLPILYSQVEQDLRAVVR